MNPSGGCSAWAGKWSSERKQAERRELWRQRIAEQKNSGQTVRAYCRERGLAEHAPSGKDSCCNYSSSSFMSWLVWMPADSPCVNARSRSVLLSGTGLFKTLRQV